MAQTDPDNLTEVATEIDRYVYDQALAVFLCAPQALIAVNNEVKFTGQATTFELADLRSHPATLVPPLAGTCLLGLFAAAMA